MSKQIPQTSILESLALVKDSNLPSVFKLYNVGTSKESDVLPQVVCVSPELLRALKMIIAAAEAYTGAVYIAIGRYGWAKDTKPSQAVKKLKADRPSDSTRKFTYCLYRAHQETRVCGDGSWEYPQGCAPVLLEEVK